MRQILHVATIKRNVEVVWAALTTQEGLSSWWTTQVACEGASSGDGVRFTFLDGFNPQMEISAVETQRLLRWTCDAGAELWIGGTFEFRLTPVNGHTELRFQQTYSREIPDREYGVFNYNWAFYLESLRLYCEDGAGKPFEPAKGRSPRRHAGGGTAISGLRYRDAKAAIEFLCKAFGFERHLVVEGDGDAIAHAQLTLGNGMIMLGTDREDDFGQHISVPLDVDTVTQSVYLVVEGIEAHYRQAVNAGAEILSPLEDQDYGGKLYTARDPEGHIWSFGTYDPWAT